MGDFLAYQFATDLNYSELVDFSEMEFVVPGPGARDGIRKCFVDTSGLGEGDVIRLMAERAHHEFERLDEAFQTLWGRELQLIDCQNLFCEVGKYARVVHPSIVGQSGRSRIKQNFLPSSDPLPQWYPPKWRLDVPTELLMDPEGSERQRQQVLLFNERAEGLQDDREGHIRASTIQNRLPGHLESQARPQAAGERLDATAESATPPHTRGAGTSAPRA
jgi:hypothetical protein